MLDDFKSMVLNFRDSAFDLSALHKHFLKYSLCLKFASFSSLSEVFLGEIRKYQLRLKQH